MPRLRLVAAAGGAALVVFVAGFGLGYVTRGARARAAVKSPNGSLGGAVWQFKPTSATTICGDGGGQNVLAALSAGTQGPLPPRLSDHMLSASPVGDYKVTYDGPAAVPDRPWEAIAIQDAVDGYSRSYTSTTHAGGFGISAYQFPNHVAALSSVAAGYRAFVCRFGADPLAVAGHPGILAGTRPSEIVAMWVEGPRLVLVDYSRFGQPQQDVAQALVAIQATWSLSESAPPPTANSS